MSVEPSPQVIAWEDPPKRVYSRRAQTEWQLLADRLRERPGEWALVASGQRTNSGAQALKRAGCETRSVKDPDTRLFSTYARWPEDA